MADQMDQEQKPAANTSGLNTVLLIVILVAVAIFAGWWLSSRNQAPVEDNEAGVEINLPDPGSEDTQDTETVE